VAGSGDAEIARLPTVVSEASKSGTSAAHAGVAAQACVKRIGAGGRGCDLFEFTDGKISRKDSFWEIID
jgi:hypothetical protein